MAKVATLSAGVAATLRAAGIPAVAGLRAYTATDGKAAVTPDGIAGCLVNLCGSATVNVSGRTLGDPTAAARASVAAISAMAALLRAGYVVSSASVGGISFLGAFVVTRPA